MVIVIGNGTEEPCRSLSWKGRVSQSYRGMNPILSLIIWLVTLLTLAFSLRLALVGVVRFPQAKPIRWVTSKGWSFFVFVLFFWHMGKFARGAASPFPWRKFSEEAMRHGFIKGLFSALPVLIVDLWMFWMPLNLLINYKPPGLDFEKKCMVIIINVLLGLLLAMENNPIHGFPMLFL